MTLDAPSVVWADLHLVSRPPEAPAVMAVKSVRVRNLFGQDHNIKFQYRSVLIGPNGCGKTAILELISLLAGPMSTDILLTDRPSRRLIFDEAEIKVSVNGKNSRFRLSGKHPDLGALAIWKKQLALHASFMNHEFDFAGDLVAKPAPIDYRIGKLKDVFGTLDMDLRVNSTPNRRFVYKFGHGAQCMSNFFMRLPALGSPILFENIEDGLDVENQRLVGEKMGEWLSGSQILCTTHSPIVLSAMMQTGVVSPIAIGA